MVNTRTAIRAVLFAITFPVYALLAVSSLSAAGKAEEAEQAPLNSDWTLCITAFDTSALPAAQRIIGNVVTRGLVDTLNVIQHRIRVSPEYAYYEGYAWSQAVTAAAKALSAKQDERTLLLYRGEADWRYQRNLKRVDADIARLREEFEKKEAEKPLINNEPEFKITQSNRDGNYPAPPVSGGEYRFCQNQKADAFLTGSIRDFHGRYYVTLRLYALYTRSFVYEDSIIFSADDTAVAVDEIAGRLIAALSGSRPATVAVRTEPEETLVLINRSFAGRGQVETREYPPGKLVVAVSAENYQPEILETDLLPGEHTEISVVLSPLQYGEVNIDVPGRVNVSVYHGALYVGEAPLNLRLPIDQLDYFTVETQRGETAKAVFQTPERPDETYNFSLRTNIPPSTGQKRVNKARNWYYWAWGATWLTGIAAWVSNGIYTSQNEAYQRGVIELFEDTQRMYYISTGAFITFGVAAVYGIVQMARYLYTATEDSTPIIKQDKKKE
ncbi:MAG: PEGA domain-containing protein [Treponema sp.]|jgi:hypothetical protein|nr:PEGA domain-containing protein [Treponema sp.]